MTVAELIALLQQQPPTMRVVVRGYEDGVDDIQSLKPTRIKLDAHNEWYYGRHGCVYDDDEPADETALQLSASPLHDHNS